MKERREVKRDGPRVQSLDPSELYVWSDSCRIYHGPCEFCLNTFKQGHSQDGNSILVIQD